MRNPLKVDFEQVDVDWDELWLNLKRESHTTCTIFSVLLSLLKTEVGSRPNRMKTINAHSIMSLLSPKRVIYLHQLGKSIWNSKSKTKLSATNIMLQFGSLNWKTVFSEIKYSWYFLLDYFLNQNIIFFHVYLWCL